MTAAASPDIEAFTDRIGSNAGHYPTRKARNSRDAAGEDDLRRALDALSRADPESMTAAEPTRRVTMERLTVALCRWYGCGRRWAPVRRAAVRQPSRYGGNAADGVAMRRLRRLAGVAVVALVVGACGGTDPARPADPAPDAGSSIVAPLDHATEVADQADQRTAELENMLEELAP